MPFILSKHDDYFYELSNDDMNTKLIKQSVTFDCLTHESCMNKLEDKLEVLPRIPSMKLKYE